MEGHLPAGFEALFDQITEGIDHSVGPSAAGIDDDQGAGIELRGKLHDGVPAQIAAGVAQHDTCEVVGVDSLAECRTVVERCV